VSAAAAVRRFIADRRDIADRDEIAWLVAEFYRRAFADEILGPVLVVDAARVDLSAHLPVMGEFWATVLLRAGLYRRNALPPHVALAVEVELTDAHFARWLAVWTAVVEERRPGPRAELTKTQATRIASAIRRRLPGEQASAFVSIAPRHPGLRAH
jgi:hemoglobin